MSRPRAIVTGAGGGIGIAIARRLMEDGWAVLATYNSSAESARTLTEIDGEVELIQADLGTGEGVAKIARAAADGGVGALVNNAGLIEFEERERFDRATWERTIAVNLYAPVELSMAVAPRLPKGGAVVNITSTDSEPGSYNSLAYAASKAALESANRSLANLLGPRGIRVNAISPGWIATEMADLAAETAAGLTPLGRLGTPAEVASCVSWLLSEESSFVNGASLTLDGGLANVDYVLFKEAEANEQ